MALIPGTKLGPYEIVAPLGAGGMGEVYRARDTRLSRDVAVKVLPQHLSGSPEDRARFKREAKTISSLNHPHVCVLHDVGSEGDTDYLVMELVEGETLAQRLARGALPIPDVLRLGTQIADALDRAHRAGVVHRDLKPGNVMLTKSGAKLMDFGLARAAGRARHTHGNNVTATVPGRSPKSEEPITAKGTIVGTFQYMAPEQLEGKEADARSDLWALGCVLYEMATGKRAFEGSTTASLISAIMRDQPRVMAELAPMTPPALERVVTQCLAKDPDDRWQTAGDLRRELLWIAEAGTRAGVPMPVSAKRAGRERVAWILAGVVTLVAVALSILWWRAAENRARHFSFTPLTFEPMAISNAAFAPDGKTVVFTRALEEGTRQIFVIRPEYPEPQPISEPGIKLLSVSSQGELAVLVQKRGPEATTGLGATLATMQMGGGAPREILENVRSADWSPDGSQLAVLRDIDGKNRIEFPIGNVLARVDRVVSSMRVSPRGDMIAFFEHPNYGFERGSVNALDLHGKKSVLSDGYWGLSGIAWSPDGQEVFFSASDAGSKQFAVFAVTLTGKRRPVIESAGGLKIQDVSRDGRWLAIRDDSRSAVRMHRPSWSEDRDLSWLDGSDGGYLSKDGALLAFTERSSAAGKQYAACLRKTDGSPVVRLGEGTVWDISDDGKWVLTLIPSEPPQLVVQSTGAGGTRRLNRGTLERYGFGSFIPGADSVVFNGVEPGKTWRSYVQDFSGRPPRAVTPEGTYQGHRVLDGANVWAWGLDRRWSKYPLNGGTPRPVPALTADDYFFRLNSDGRSALVLENSTGRMDRVDLVTGHRRLFLEASPPKLAGLMSYEISDIADDNQSYVYTVWWESATLFLVETAK